MLVLSYLPHHRLLLDPLTPSCLLLSLPKQPESAANIHSLQWIIGLGPQEYCTAATRMRIRLRGPSGSSTVNVTDSDTVGDLLQLISEQTYVESPDIKIGYPPQPLRLDSYDKSKPLARLGTKLDGEQLIVSAKENGGARGGRAQSVSETNKATTERSDVPPTTAPSTNESISKSQAGASFSFASVPGATAHYPTSSSKNASSAPPLALSRKGNKDVESDPPEMAMPSHSATMVLRIMPDDNSCMFRAFGSAMMGSIDGMTELRSLVAQTIQSQPDVYSAAVLDQPLDEYCRWIQTEYSWGGGIELAILSQHFDVEICSIDVQSLRVDRFNEGRPTRCVLVYSGIHYDTIALSPSDPPHAHASAPPDFDTKVFDATDDQVLAKAVALCELLQKKHYFTDTAGFAVRCNVCGASLVGEKGAAEHASATGHSDFGEAG